jgi:ligand-binding sensor domain-containing protein/two-component sensor histidine kinase
MTPAVFYLKCFCITWLLLVSGVFSAYPQSPIRELAVQTVHYDVRNGLPNNSIKKGLIDKNGLMWLITNAGLSCFDGQHFFNYEVDSPLFKISDNEVLDIALQDTLIYVATAKGIDVIDIRSKKKIKSIVLKNHTVRYIIEFKSSIFALTDKRVLVDLKHKRSLRLGDKSDNYTMVKSDDYLVIMNLKSSYYAVVDPLKFKIIKEVNIQRNSYYTDGLIYTKSYGMINLLMSGTMQFDPITGKEKPITDFFHPITNYTDQLDLGEMYVVNYNLIMYRNKNIDYKITIDSPDYIYFNQILTDGRGTVYLLYSKGITIFRLPPSFIRPLPTLPTTIPETYQVYKSIIELPNKNLLLFTYLGIYEFNPNTWKVTVRWNRWTYAVSGLEINNDLYFVADGKGLARLDKKGYRQFSVPKFSDSQHAYSIIKNNQDQLILGFTNPYGLYRFDENTETILPVNSSLGDGKKHPRGINKILQDARGHYWVATHNGLFILDQQYKTLVVFDRHQKSDRMIEQDYIHDFYVDTDSTLWVGTSHGVYSIDMHMQRLLNQDKQPYLDGNRVASILDDDRGNLWVSTFTGLYVFNKKTHQSYRYFQEDGLSENEFNGLSALKASDGKLYFGALNGYLQIDPKVWDPTLYATTLSINAVQKDGFNRIELIDINNVTADQPLRMYADRDILNFQVSFDEYINPTFCKYWFRLSENDPWLPFYDGNLRLRNLPTGSYLLEIKGTDAMGREEIATLEIPIHVSVTFFNSFAFRISLIVLMACAFVGFMYYRYKSLLELNSVRKNIINDIHDEIGSILTKTAMKAELLATKHTAIQKDLKQIQGYTREAVQSLRNLLWSLSSENATTVDFQDRVNEWLTFMFADSNFEVEFINQIPKTAFNLSISARRNVLLIVKELATNCLKHSNGNVFQLKLSETNGKYELTAFDNGSNDTADTTISGSGFGIKSIINRVTLLGGSFSYYANKKGFSVQIIF